MTGLPYDPARFLEFAEKILNDSRYEQSSRIRTSVGRSYYSAFLLTRKKLEDLGVSFSTADRIHQQVISATNEKNSDLANRLDTLRRYRVDADYSMDAAIDLATAKKCAKISRGISHLLGQLR